MYDSILDALRRGDTAAALPAARDLAAAQPTDATAQRLLAAVLRLSGDSDAALAALDAALALEPENADLHLERAGLLLGAQQLDAAQAALASSTSLDPNQFPAYIIQAHLAIGRGELDEAERLARTAARIAPEHPLLTALQGTLALRRNEPDRALALLSQAAQQAPDNPLLRHELGLAYLAKGHHAFAEQAFRRLLEDRPDWTGLRTLLAEVVRRQGRPGDAADELAPLLERADAAPGLQRLMAEFELQAGRTEQALPRLRAAFAALPGDRRVLAALVEAWSRLGLRDEAQATLDAALADHPQLPGLWQARLAIEPFAGDAARAIVERWVEAMPGFIPALQARATVLDAAGEHDAAEAVAQRIVELQPGHAQAELRVVDGLLRRDPAAAVARLQHLIARAPDPAVQRGLRQLLGQAFNAAGQPEAAAAAWAAVHAEAAAQRLPLPPLAGTPAGLPPLAPLPEPAPGVLLLWGPPGSLVERIAVNFELTGGPLLADRYGPTPPQDDLQRYGVAQDGLDPAGLVERWRAALPARGVADGNVFDWLLWWDNALLPALRAHLPEALLLVALRDPRDMLLDWLAFGAAAPFALESPEAGARWLAQALAQVAELHEGDLFPHRLVRMDAIAEDPQALAAALGEALDAPVPPVDRAAFGPAHFAPGRWRDFAGPLGAAFAELAPVAQRLGYPAD